MLTQKQRYEYVPAGGDPSLPIVIFGLQEYSPGQSQKVDVWRFEVPEGVGPEGLHGAEVESWVAVLRTLKSYFPTQ